MSPLLLLGGTPPFAPPGSPHRLDISPPARVQDPLPVFPPVVERVYRASLQGVRAGGTADGQAARNHQAVDDLPQGPVVKPGDLGQAPPAGGLLVPGRDAVQDGLLPGR